MNKQRVFIIVFSLFILSSGNQIQAQSPSLNTPTMDDAKDVFSQANIYYKTGRFLDAVKEYQRILKTNPNDFAANTRLGLSYIKLRQPTEAIEVFRKAASLQPKNATAYVNLSYGYLEASRFDEALKAAEQSVELNPSNAIGFNNLGYAHLRLRNYSEAVKVLDQSIELDENYVKAYSNLGRAYYFLGQHENAAKVLRQAVKMNPNEWESHSVLGQVNFLLERYQEATQELQEAIRLDPSKPSDYFLCGQAFMLIRHYEEAVETITQGLKLSPQEAGAYYGRAYANLNLGRGKAAVDDAQAYLTISEGQNKSFPYLKLVIYFGNRQAGNQAEANLALDEAIIKSDADVWPIPVFQYLRNDISAQDLLFKADDGNKKTEAYAYIGLQLSLSGKGEEAIKYLQWVKENGNRKFNEYSLALSELTRVDKSSR